MVELELWDYDPRLSYDKLHVDLLSLYASMESDFLTATEDAFDVPTVPQNNRTPLWFRIDISILKSVIISFKMNKLNNGATVWYKRGVE